MVNKRSVKFCKLLSRVFYVKFRDTMADPEPIQIPSGSKDPVPSVTWVYSLPKEKLTVVMATLGLDATGTVEELRKRFSKFLKIDVTTRSRNNSPTRTDQTQNRGETGKDNIPVCEKVRKWGLTFDGIRDGVAFLERVRELQECYNLAEKDLLNALPLLFREKALLWYRNNKTSWSSWDDFINDFKIQYFPARYDF